MGTIYITDIGFLFVSETCTAAKNRGGGGAEDDKNLNVVAVAATA